MPTVERKRGGVVIFLTVLLAILLSIVDLPDQIEYWRPAFVPLVVIYWCLAIPQRFGIATAWLIGLFIDVLMKMPVGQNALGFAVIAYIVLNFYQRIRISPLVQQTLTVFAILVLYQLIIAWFTSITIYTPSSKYFLASLVSALIWPLVYMLLRSIRRRFRIR